MILIGRDYSDSLISLSRALSLGFSANGCASPSRPTRTSTISTYITPLRAVASCATNAALGPTGSQSSELGAVVGTVVGVVGKSHVPGITAAWNAPEATRREKVAKALEEPPPPSRLLALGGGALGLGARVGIARSRTMRRVAGASSLALGGGATWLVVALRDRLDYFERSQKKQEKR